MITRTGSLSIGVGHAQGLEDFALALLHGVRIVLRLVVVADEMQEPMHRQMGQVMEEPLALGGRLPLQRLAGDHDVAERNRPAHARRRRGCGKR